MTENLFQFIWKNQYFNRSNLETVQSEQLQVIHPGQFNMGQGPDFLNARIRLGETNLAGSIELHLKTSDWNKHGHQHDPNYQNVILHVVLQHDLPYSDLPLLELENRIARPLLERYQGLMDNASFIPCGASIGTVNALTLAAWKERLVAERLLHRNQMIISLLELNQYHWEEVFWWLLARNFGFSANSEAFEAIARSIPITVLAKHKHQIQQLEALLLGQANLLEGNFEDPYALLLQREYLFLKNKYELKPVPVPVFFMRMRPSNFPTIRLAQLAMLIYKSDHLFSKLIETTDVNDLLKWLDVTANDFWHYHYRLTERSAFKPKHLGKFMIDSLIINTLVPMLFAYGHFHQKEELKNRAIAWLEKVPPETNSIITQFQKLTIHSVSAFDSQALLELKKQYCTPKHCLNCSVGHSLLRNTH